MNSEIANMTPRQVWVGLAKLSISMTLGLLIAAFLISLLTTGKSDVTSIALNALLLAVAVSVLASGVRTMLSIFDWFEVRKAKTNG